MSELRRRAGVDEDIFEIAAYLSEQSLPLANQFIDSVEQTLKELADSPKIGSRKEFDGPLLARVRTWWVKGFPNHLIYYLPLRGGIDVLAIMHGAQLPEAKLRRRGRRQ